MAKQEKGGLPRGGGGLRACAEVRPAPAGTRVRALVPKDFLQRMEKAVELRNFLAEAEARWKETKKLRE